eukprot:GAFH01005310.1.p4 GENE.GAFH01005310.1~~GAFH01005310.1.p4  ORF type:complete len:64 (-),score=13.91 GAFH01005310.1:211-402(-)
MAAEESGGMKKKQSQPKAPHSRQDDEAEEGVVVLPPDLGHNQVSDHIRTREEHEEQAREPTQV